MEEQLCFTFRPVKKPQNCMGIPSQQKQIFGAGVQKFELAT